MKIVECDQGSPEWMLARSGIPTASELDSLLTPLWKIKTGEGPNSYMCRKLAEWWQGHPLPSFVGAFAVEQGQILETHAKPWFTLQYDQAITNVGFITTDDGEFGCSPDGLFEDGTGIEIKCPYAETHVNYLLAGKLPSDYVQQVHGCLYVTGAPHWTFFSYRKGFPDLVVKVERDELIQAAIGKALAEFQERFEAGKKRLMEINGGPPKRTPAMPTLHPTTTELKRVAVTEDDFTP